MAKPNAQRTQASRISARKVCADFKEDNSIGKKSLKKFCIEISSDFSNLFMKYFYENRDRLSFIIRYRTSTSKRVSVVCSVWRDLCIQPNQGLTNRVSKDRKVLPQKILM